MRVLTRKASISELAAISSDGSSLAVIFASFLEIGGLFYSSFSGSADCAAWPHRIDSAPRRLPSDWRVTFHHPPLERRSCSVPQRHHFAWLLNYPAVSFGPEFLRLFIDCLSNAHDSAEGTVCSKSVPGREQHTIVNR